MKQAIGFGSVLVLLANAFALFLYVAGISRQWVYLPWGLLLLTTSLIWARRRAGLGWSDLGVSGNNLKQSIRTGALVGLGLSIVLVVFFLFPVVLTGPVRYSSIEELDSIGLVWRLGVDLTIAVALTEEVLFRGILQALFRQALSVRGAVVATSITFALWHLVVNALSLQQNPVTLLGLPSQVALGLGYVGALVAVGAGGGILSTLRERTGNLAGSVLVHWAADAVMTLVIYAR